MARSDGGSVADDGERERGFTTLDGQRVVPREGLAIGRRTAALLAGLAVLAVALAYDLLVAGGDPLVAGWDPVAIDWLFLPALYALVLYVVVPLVTRPARARAHWEQLRHNRLATASFVYVVGFVLVGTLGPVVVGLPTSDLARSHLPPAFLTTPAAFVTDCAGPVVEGACRGTLEHPLGTNIYGQSLVALLVAGARVALQVVVVTGALVVPIAVAVGVLAGYYGGRIDDLLMRYVDIQRSVPAFLVYLILIFVFGRSLFMLVVVFGLFNWGGVARLVRADVRQVTEQKFFLAAENAGAGDLQLVRNHVVPNVSGTVLAATTRMVSTLILIEAALAYLNLNDMNVPSWGESIAAGFQAPFPEMWWMSTLPALALTITVVAFSVLGNALADVLDPRQTGDA